MTASVTKQDFKAKVLDSQLPVLVDFSATWCGPCRMLAPVVEELEGEMAGRVAFYKVDIDESRELALQYGISSVPSLILFKDGQAADQMVGAVPKQTLEQFIEKALG